jgi:hypothetical protein
MQGNGPALRGKDAPAPSVGQPLLWRIRSKVRGMIAALARWWQRLTDRKVREGGAESPSMTVADVKQADAHEALQHGRAKQGNGPVLPTKPDFPQESCRLRLTDPRVHHFGMSKAAKPCSSFFSAPC